MKVDVEYGGGGVLEKVMGVPEMEGVHLQEGRFWMGLRWERQRKAFGERVILEKL